MIRHDQSDVSVVTTCTDCPWWSRFSFTLAEAEAAEVAHNMLVHGMEPSRASAAARIRHRRARHAV